MSTTAAFGALPNSAQATVGTTAAVVVAATTSRSPRAGNGVFVKAPLANTNPVFIGGEGVTTSTGVPLEKGTDMWIPISDPSLLYAIVASGTETLALFWL